MSHSKPTAMKRRLMKKLNQNRRVPAWVMMRTNRTFTRHPHRRSWRYSKLKE
ncbi:MAG: 50S ribosomal protein L39e [Methanomassiliicoccales archaeon PtaU1.Bin124]|nr:MAG: 50S ribosomal protein L39e [Methanomassiliicoccales archaeon PtaU1.Bin124]